MLPLHAKFASKPRATMVVCKSTPNERLKFLHDDITKLYEQRLSSIVAIDKVIRDAVDKDIGARKAIIEKCFDIARTDWSSCTKATETDSTTTIQTPAIEKKSDSTQVAEDPYFEPWVIDD